MPRASKTPSTLTTQVSRQGLELFLESTRTLVVLVDINGIPLSGNLAFERLRQSERSSVSLVDLVVPSQREMAQKLLDSARQGDTPVRGQLEFGPVGKSLNCNCLLVPAEQDTTLIFGEPVPSEGALLSANHALLEELRSTRDALAIKTTELQAVMAQADELAHTDSLTFLPNRRSIISDLQRHVAYAERYGTPLAISMVDLDGFKLVNDSLGHQAGDEILGKFARELRDHIRQPDEIGRYGGDEFLVILPSSTATAASEQATRLCQHIRTTPIPVGEKSIHPTLSAGIAQFERGVDNWQSLLERADRALYEAKRLGGDQWLILEL